MGFLCSICGINSLFIFWSSGRNFPKEDLGNYLNVNHKYLNVPVCYHCCKKNLNYPKDIDE